MINNSRYTNIYLGPREPKLEKILGFLEKYPRIEKQTRGFQKHETFLKLKTLKTAVEQMFSHCVCAQSAVLSLVLTVITKTWKNKQLTIPLIQTHEESTGFGTGLE